MLLTDLFKSETQANVFRYNEDILINLRILHYVNSNGDGMGDDDVSRDEDSSG